MLNNAYYSNCPECSRPLLPGQRLHLDHIVARSLGGPDHPGNLQVLHAACNLRKGNRLPNHVYATWRFRAILVENGILEGQPIRAISWLEPIADWDSGLAAWNSQANQVRDCKPVHIGCFIDAHPEACEGMDLARQHGEAIYNGNDWVDA